ncbi:hypothetical protein KSS87_017057 [Heliosperma pusillum]|nr:hypothetical protein KSS87_017057 [Heliosperma pusillum]
MGGLRWTRMSYLAKRVRRSFDPGGSRMDPNRAGHGRSRIQPDQNTFHPYGCRLTRADFCLKLEHEMEPGKLFIGGISWETNEDRLREYFETFGEVVEAVIMKDRVTGRARGFGFVIYADPAVAERVVRQQHVIDGRTVEAKKAVPRDDQHIVSRNHGSSPIASPMRTNKIFVGGLASTVTEGDFKRYFDQFGTITDVVVMYDHNTQRPRGFGFITFDSEEAAERAMIRTFHELHGKMVEVKRAVPKDVSPGPKTPLCGGLSRVNSFLSGYVQGFNFPIAGHGVRIDERRSPMSFARSSIPNFSPSGYGTALNYEPRMSPRFNEPANLFSRLSFEQGLSALNTNKLTRQHDSSAEFDAISRGSGSTLGSSWSLWGNNNSITDSTFSKNTASSGFRAGDVEANSFTNSDALWNPSHVSNHANGRPSASNGLNLNYGREDVNRESAMGLYGRVSRASTLAPSFPSLDGGYEAKFYDFSVGGSEQPWPLGMKGSGSFELELARAVPDIPLNNPAGLCW